MYRLTAHSAVGDALAGAEISELWARKICERTDLLPEQHRDRANQILLGAAAGGATLRDLEALAEEIRTATAAPTATTTGSTTGTRRQSSCRKTGGAGCALRT